MSAADSAASSQTQPRAWGRQVGRTITPGAPGARLLLKASAHHHPWRLAKRSRISEIVSMIASRRASDPKGLGLTGLLEGVIGVG